MDPWVGVQIASLIDDQASIFRAKGGKNSSNPSALISCLLIGGMLRHCANQIWTRTHIRKAWYSAAKTDGFIPKAETYFEVSSHHCGETAARHRFKTVYNISTLARGVGDPSLSPEQEEGITQSHSTPESAKDFQMICQLVPMVNSTCTHISYD